MKALIIGADAVEPSVIFANRDIFPNLNKMIETGASASYAAYVQKGYNGSYSSEQNWASIYTGLSPKEHGITTHSVRGEKRRPQMHDFAELEPFWKVLNDNGYSVGLWAADNCANPVKIDGYCVSVKYEMIETPIENRLSPRQLQVCDKDNDILNYIAGDVPPRLYPKTLEQQGYKFSQLLSNNDLANRAVEAYHFQDALPNFERELQFFFGSMRKAQQNRPVDVLFWYTVTTDLIPHCCLCCDDNDVLIEAYKLLDKYIGEFVDEFRPEITIFLSDHGQKNFNELVKCSDSSVQREAFAASDEVLWLNNGYIAFEAHNGALLFTYHSLEGTFIASGKGIRHAVIEEMRTLDIYPTLLELFGIEVPDCRSGFIIDIFSRTILNTDKLLVADVPRKSIALFQVQDVSTTDIIINELFIEQRFAKITVIGEAKYEEIYKNNPRVDDFCSNDNFDSSRFDEIYRGYWNSNTGKYEHRKEIK